MRHRTARALRSAVMRIGFDASPLARPHPPGIVRVVESALAALERADGVEVVRLAPEPSEPLARWRRRTLAAASGKQSLAGIHSFLSAFPWRGPGLRVQTIHELPWKHGVAENADWRHKLWARFGPRRADAVITATEYTAREIGRPLAREGGRVHVVGWGVDERFAEEPPLGTVDEVVLTRYRLPEGPFALCPGAVRAKKNLAAVLHGAARLHASGGPKLTIVVSGPDTQDLRRDLGLASQLGLSRWVSTPGTIEEEDLPAILRLAAVVPVLSRSEGFGLPVLEALACGTPVVVPADSAQAEVAGEDGIRVDPGDADAVAAGLRQAIETREEQRYVLPERARAFTWERTARGIADVWRAIT
ncbi:MAG: glycosyltransferase family 4 protein [bacterium]|nr:glycosyltransferase family 4 protein [bacterium]